ncbi:hypothetical protein Tco_1440576 [Tanacetum coccineum]
MWIAFPLPVGLGVFDPKNRLTHQRYINKDLGVSESDDLFTLACGPTSSPISVQYYCVVERCGEDDHDVIYFKNSSDLALSISLDDLDFATLNIDGQSKDVDAPPDIIDVDEDDDLIDDKDALPHDLADSDDEDLTNDDDDDVAVVYSSEEED